MDKSITSAYLGLNLTNRRWPAGFASNSGAHLTIGNFVRHQSAVGRTESRVVTYEHHSSGLSGVFFFVPFLVTMRLVDVLQRLIHDP